MINYVKGDATNPTFGNPDATKVIIHICNNVGGWGRGFVLALSKRWKQPEESYRRQFNSLRPTFSGKRFMKLGTFTRIYVENNIHVVNMMAQHGIEWENGIPPIRYDALEECCDLLSLTLGSNEEIHCPRIGCGLAGGTWDRIEPILAKFQVPVYVYDLE